MIKQLKFWKGSNILHPLAFEKGLNMTGIIRTILIFCKIWMQEAFRVFMFFIKLIFSQNYQNKEE